MNSINIKELLKEIEQENINIIDIRNSIEYSKGHIPTAKNIPYQLLAPNPGLYLEKKEKYYIYCQFGTSSNYLVTRLNNLGYNTVNITGGYNNYLFMK